MKCPKCDAAMELVTFEGIEVDRCTDCRGLWFDSREDERLRKMRGSEKIDIGDAKVGKRYNDLRDVKCPKCKVKMLRMVDPEQPHIWFESCGVCHGVYFDAGEFRDAHSHTLLDVFRDWFARERK